VRKQYSFQVSPGEVPEAVARFLGDHIRSVMQLELLMLLSREPERWWTADSVNRELRSSIEACAQDLRMLAKEGLAEVIADADPRYRYRLARAEDEPVMARLTELFRTHFHALVHAVYARRRRDVRAFADAFKIKKDRKDDDG
jgi:hypothetical protein